MILSISTSSGYISTSLFSAEGREISTIINEEKNRQSKFLSKQCAELFQKSGIGFKDISMIFIDKGPGGFTGIRSGISFIAGLFFASGIKIVEVCSLSALTYHNLKMDGLYLTIITISKSENYYQFFELKDRFLQAKECGYLSDPKIDLLLINKKIDFIAIAGDRDDANADFVDSRMIADYALSSDLLGHDIVVPLYIKDPSIGFNTKRHDN